ncbi:MAG: peptidylprolyl isomerase [Terrimicrobiaceae bacterium]
MKITSGKVVLIDYTLTDDQKQTIDSSEGHEPLAYIHGSGQIIPGLEKALDGRVVGDALRVDVPAAEGYGEHDAEKIINIPRSQVEGVPDLKVGIQLQASGGGGPQVVTVTKLTDNEVTLDGNHPLAGKNLHFDVTIREVRDATDEEIAHGHVHGPGGHHH